MRANAPQPPADPAPNPWIEQRRRRAHAIAEQKKAKRLAEVQHRHDDPIKRRFREVARNAIKAGKITPKPCSWRCKDGSWCNATTTEFHHLDYESGHELQGRWLCREHHQVLTLADVRKKAREERLQRPIRAPGVVVIED